MSLSLRCADAWWVQVWNKYWNLCLCFSLIAFILNLGTRFLSNSTCMYKHKRYQWRSAEAFNCWVLQLPASYCPKLQSSHVSGASKLHRQLCDVVPMSSRATDSYWKPGLPSKQEQSSTSKNSIFYSNRKILSRTFLQSPDWVKSNWVQSRKTA